MSKQVKVVCFGGGTGLSSLLSGLKRNPWLDISAIVTMFDSGGSSGELRDRFGILPPGDILKCILALSEREQFTREILLKRIPHASYSGHTGGNILLLGLEHVFGDFATAVDVLRHVLSVKGHVYPVSLECSNLCAQFADGTIARQETAIDHALDEGRRISRLFLDPVVGSNAKALEAIAAADVICIGPGSFYTSLLPNFLPEGTRDAIAASRAPIIYIANLLTEGEGMRGYTIPRITAILEATIGRQVDAIVSNALVPPVEELADYTRENKFPLILADDTLSDPRFISAPLWTDSKLARHDPSRLAYLLSSLIHRLAK